ncbi:hypothetical protein L1K70_23720, partial [Salmonella enterica subsp. enterica serovar Anatum]|nr:hypothetical protein [Salmonella enterica subsp. enterica serovar Anatum]
MMNDAFAKDNNENSLHSFLFLSRLNLTRRLSRQPLMKKMMNDAFAKDNNENSLHSFLFLSRL